MCPGRLLCRAAASTCISSTALITQLDLFEVRLVFKLFKRSPRGLTLTEQGKTLLNDVEELEAKARLAVRRAALTGLVPRLVPDAEFDWLLKVPVLIIFDDNIADEVQTKRFNAEVWRVALKRERGHSNLSA